MKKISRQTKEMIVVVATGGIVGGIVGFIVTLVVKLLTGQP